MDKEKEVHREPNEYFKVAQRDLEPSSPAFQFRALSVTPHYLLGFIPVNMVVSEYLFREVIKM
jgi:hypothetical protein